MRTTNRKCAHRQPLDRPIGSLEDACNDALRSLACPDRHCQRALLNRQGRAILAHELPLRGQRGLGQLVLAELEDSLGCAVSREHRPIRPEDLNRLDDRLLDGSDLRLSGCLEGFGAFQAARGADHRGHGDGEEGQQAGDDERCRVASRGGGGDREEQSDRDRGGTEESGGGCGALSHPSNARGAVATVRQLWCTDLRRPITDHRRLTLMCSPGAPPRRSRNDAHELRRGAARSGPRPHVCGVRG